MITSEEAIKITEESKKAMEKEDQVFIDEFLVKIEKEIREACGRGETEVEVDFPYQGSLVIEIEWFVELANY